MRPTTGAAGGYIQKIGYWSRYLNSAENPTKQRTANDWPLFGLWYSEKALKYVPMVRPGSEVYLEKPPQTTKMQSEILSGEA